MLGLDESTCLYIVSSIATRKLASRGGQFSPLKGELEAYLALGDGLGKPPTKEISLIVNPFSDIFQREMNHPQNSHFSGRFLTTTKLDFRDGQFLSLKGELEVVLELGLV